MTRLVMPLSLLLAVPLAWPAAAQPSRSVSWERFDATIELLPDSTLRVIETQQVRFDGMHRQLDREIPLGQLSSITEVQVSEMGRGYSQGYNQPETFAVGRNEDRLRIDWWFPSTSNSTRTFELRYRVSGAIRVYDSGDELVWMAVPAARHGDVQASEVVVRLPAELPAGQVGVSAHPDSPPDNAPRSVGPREVQFTATDLPPEQGYQIRLQLPHGIVTARPPAWQSTYDRQVWLDSLRPFLNLVLVVAAAMTLAGGLLLIFLRWRPRTSGPADVMRAAEVETPPSGLPPAVVGMLVDGRADSEHALATLLVLASRGVIRIDKDEGPSQLTSGRGYRLELLQDQPLGLRTYEKTLIGALFGSDREVRLSEAKARWGPNMWLFKSQVQEEVVRAGLLAEKLGITRRPGRTRAGAAEAARWRAFARHLSSPRKQPEPGNLAKLTRELPYAVALGVVDRFRPEHVGRRTPGWAESTAGEGGTDQALKADGLYEMLEAASEALSAGGDFRR